MSSAYPSRWLALFIAAVAIPTLGPVHGTEPVPASTVHAPVRVPERTPVASVAAGPVLTRSPWSSRALGPHRRVWEQVVAEPAAQGPARAWTNRYVEVATGLNAWDPGRGAWLPSAPEFALTRSGHWVTRGSALRVVLAPDLNTVGAVDAQVEGGVRLRSTPLGIGLHDTETGESVRVAEITSCRGQRLGPGTVLYADAFTGVRADLRFTVSQGGFEADVILREGLALPPGFTAETTEVQVLTEFYSAPEPGRAAVSLPQASRDGGREATGAAAGAAAAAVAAAVASERVDEELDFGGVVMGAGWAFGLEAGRNATSNEAASATTGAGSGVRVGKRWALVEGRRVLIESVRWTEAVPLFSALNATDGSARSAKRSSEPRSHRGGTVTASDAGKPGSPTTAWLPAARRERSPVLRPEWAKPRSRSATAPPRRLAQAGPGTAAVTAAAPATAPGVVFDYRLELVQTNLSFEAGTTYYVSGPVVLGGARTRFEGGAVIKFAPTNQARLSLRSPVDWQATPYRPVILTGRDDATVGTIVGEGPLAEAYAAVALELGGAATNTLFEHLRIAQARTAVQLAPGGHHRLRHAQLVDCQTGFAGHSSRLTLENVLVSGVDSTFNGTGLEVHGEHLTVRDGVECNARSTCRSLELVNSLLVDAGQVGPVTRQTCTAITNRAASALLRVGAGTAYLPPSSPWRDAGTTDLAPGLWAELQQRTTQPPWVWTNLCATNVTLHPQALRDAQAPDLGYHYAPLDYALCDWTVTNATVSIAPSTVLATFGPTAGGIWLRGDSSLCAEGRPEAWVGWTRYVCVQEQPVAWGGSITNTTAVLALSPATRGRLGLRFCRFDRVPLAVRELPFYLGEAHWSASRVLMRDCESFLGALELYGPDPNGGPPVELINNRFDRTTLTLTGGLHLEFRNNLVQGGAVLFEAGRPDWVIQDNAFDGCQLVDWGQPLDHGWNGYLNGANRLAPPAPTDVVLPTLDYLAAPPEAGGGRCYPASNALRDRGSRSALEAGLSAYTTDVHQTAEADSPVDLGYHTVALLDGRPADRNANALADDLEQRRGSCFCEADPACAPATAPRVVLTHPSPGQRYPFPTHLVLEATATTAVGTIRRVEFYANHQPLGHALAPPYTCPWTVLTGGVHLLHARALNDLNLDAWSAPVSIALNQPPSVTLLEPAHRAEFIAPANLLLTARALDPDGPVREVRFFNDQRLLATVPTASSAATCTFRWTNVPPGLYPLEARVRDADGLERRSTTVLVTVRSTNTPPHVDWVSPAPGTTLHADQPLTLTANATDPDGIAHLDFFEGTNALGRVRQPPYSLTLDGLEPGRRFLRARATDTTGLSTTSTPLELEVTEPPPTPAGGCWLPIPGTLLRDGALAEILYPPDIRALWVDDAGLLYAAINHVNSGALPLVGASIWDGTLWTRSSADLFQNYIRAFLPFNGRLHVANGPADTIGQVHAWSPEGWTRVGEGTDLDLQCLATLDGDLYAAGGHPLGSDSCDGAVVRRLEAGQWRPVGSRLEVPQGAAVRAMTVWHRQLYIGGEFTAAEGNPEVRYLAGLVDGRWRPVGSGVNGPVRAFAVRGSTLLVGGDFTTAGGRPARGVAAWDGLGWSALGRGVEADPGVEDHGAPTVRALAVRGDQVFVGGAFTHVWDGPQRLAVGSVARATWHRTERTWTWAPLGYGAGLGEFSCALVQALALRDRPETGSYDLFAAGWFDRIDENRTWSLARWVPSLTPTAPPSSPTVTLLSPTNNQTFTTGLAIPIAAVATPARDRVVTRVVLEVDGQRLADNADARATATLTGATRGPHIVTARAYDDTTGRSAAVAVVITVQPPETTTAALALDDSFTLAAHNGPTRLEVLANDRGLVRVADAQRFFLPGLPAANPLGLLRVDPDQRAVLYTPNPYAFGTDAFTYTALDTHGRPATAHARVHVRALPEVTVLEPPDGTLASPTGALVVRAQARDRDGRLTALRLELDGQPLAVTNFAPHATPPNPVTFEVNWSPPASGTYSLRALATDNDAQTQASDPVTVWVPSRSAPPIARLDPLTHRVATSDGLTPTDDPVLREAFLDLRGQARDPDNDPVTYALWLYRPDQPDQPVADLTPPPRDPLGFHQGPDRNGDLGPLDFTALPNGVYDLELRVRAGGDERSDTLRFLLDQPLALGRLTFTELDLDLGFPLRLARRYDSHHLRPADFGPGWSLEGFDLDVALDEERAPLETAHDPAADPTESSPDGPCPTIRTGGGRNLTLTLPDGRRVTFAFAPRLAPLVAYAEWRSPPGVAARLTLPGDNTINPFQHGLGVPVWSAADPRTPFDAVDLPAFHLTTLDGTVYELERDPAPLVWVDHDGAPFPVQPFPNPPRLRRIRHPAGDTLELTPNALVHRRPDGQVTRTLTLERDPAGRIRALRDPLAASNGPPVLRYLYHESTGNLLEVHRLLDRSLATYATNRYRYDHPRFPHHLTALVDATGTVTVRNQYDDRGRLERQLDAAGRSREWLHDTTNRLEVLTDRTGARTTHAYDPRGNLTALTDPLGHTTRYTHDALDRLIAQTDPLGHTTRFEYDPNGLLTAFIEPTGATHRFEYDAHGRCTLERDPAGHTVRYTYDARGRLGAAVTPLTTNTYAYDPLGRLERQTDPLGTATAHAYDAQGNRTETRVLDPAGLLLEHTATAYDPNGNPIATTRFLTLTNGTREPRTTRFAYDAQNRLTQSIDPAGRTNITRFDVNGRVMATVDPAGRTRTCAYDALGQLTTLTWPDGLTERFEYDPEGRRTRAIDRANRSTSFRYDAAGQLLETTLPDLSTQRTAYDPAGRPFETIDPRGVTHRFGYDPAGRLVALTNAWATPAQAVTRHAYDPTGNLVQTIDPTGRSTRFEYDPEGRRTATLFPDQTRVATRYDASGNPLAQLDATGRTNRFDYDPLGRLIAVGNPLGHRTTYAYDPAGNLERHTDALGRSTRFEYDPAGRRTRRIRPGSQTERFDYDPAGNLECHTHADGRVLTYRYDPLGRLSSQWHGSTQLVSLTYTPTGQLASRTDATGTHRFVYDARDRLCTNVTPVGTLIYAYDPAGHLTGLRSTTPNGVALTYQYDALGRLTNVVDQRLPATRRNTVYTYDPAGNLRTLTHPNGLSAQLAYDRRDRLTNLTWSRGTATLARFDDRLDPNGHRLRRTDTLDGLARTADFQYDAADRLVRETLAGAPPTGTITYTLDPVGNRLRRTVTGSLTNLLAPQSFAYTLNDGLTTDTYDPNGALTRTGTQRYAYDHARRLTNANSGQVTFRYDYPGHALARTAGDQTTLYLVATVNPTGLPQVVEEFTVTGATSHLARVYTHGLNLLAQRDLTRNTLHYRGWDAQDTTRFLATDTGALADTYTFDAYGNRLAATGSTPNPHLYTGEPCDPVLGLYHLRARLYHPNTGRFLTPDPFEGRLTQPPSLHPYLYAFANPLTYADPTGLDPLVSTTLAATLGTGLHNKYDAGVTAVGNTLKNTAFGVSSGRSVGQIVVLNLLDNAGGVGVGKLAKAVSHLRRTPGVARGLGMAIHGSRWLRGSHGNAGFVPAQIAKTLAGRRFRSFDELRREFWMLVAKDPALSKGFHFDDLVAMRNGHAPAVDATQALGNRATYELHHSRPIQHGGGLYDLDNVVVVTPRYHKEILEPAYHF